MYRSKVTAAAAALSKQSVHELVRREGNLSNTAIIRSFLQKWRDAKQLSLPQLKKAMEVFLGDKEEQLFDLGLQKPSGMKVREMFRADMFCSGSNPLPPERVRLIPSALSKHHLVGCATCNTAGSVLPSCYFSSMRRCVTHGWHPTFIGKIRPLYVSHGNSPKVALFNRSVRKEFDMMVANQVVQSGSLRIAGRYGQAYFSPIGVVLKNSDISRAMELARVSVKDQGSLDRANLILHDMCLKEMKIRLTANASQPGVNASALTPPFRYPAASHATALIIRNGYMGKIDITRYYYMFGFADESTRFFWFYLYGLCWRFLMVFFGFSAAPYHISTWSAEFQCWFSARGIPCCHMMDDWFVAAASAAACDRHLAEITAIFVSIGLVIQQEKTERGQVVEYLGITYNSVTMKLSFAKAQCVAMALELQSSLYLISSGRSPSASIIAHICGKLTWYAGVIQSGRIKICSWWALMRLHGAPMSESLQSQLVSHTNWWIATLQCWARGDLVGSEFPILSYSEMLDRPEILQFVQSDASGVDGFGFFYGAVTEEDPQYVARAFDTQYIFVSSHHAELTAFSSFIQHDAPSSCILIWLSDCLSAVWSVNKGRCFQPTDLIVLEHILLHADIKHIQLIALWIPRDSNELADYLSHLSSILNRQEIRGKLSGLASAAFSGGK